jgi:hypothetical protein
MADTGDRSGRYWKISNPDGSFPYELAEMLGS